MKRKAVYPTKTSMNLFYKPDRTTKPSTIALYVLFAVVVLVGLAKWLVYDVWIERYQAEQALAAAQTEFDGVMRQLADYNEVRERYFRYSSTDEERELVDRMRVLAMLEAAAGRAALDTIDIKGSQVHIEISSVTLAQVAEIVNRLETSPMVTGTVVNTASTTGGTQGFWNFVAGDSWDLVRADIEIQIQKEAEEE